MKQLKKGWLVIVLLLSLAVSGTAAAEREDWTFIDGNASTIGLNENSGLSANRPKPAVLDDKLYIAWSETSNYYNGEGRIYVSSYDGSEWTLVSGADGLSADPSKPANEVAIAAWDGKIAVAWQEQDDTGKFQLHVKFYDPQTQAWQWAGQAEGLNYDTGQDFHWVSMATDGETLYVGWQENRGGGTALHVKKYDAAQNQWEWADGGLASGLNHYENGGGLGAEIVLAGGGGKLYATWLERSGGTSAGTKQIRAKMYDPTTESWTSIDGGQDNGLNYDETKQAEKPVASYHNSKLYVAWQEAGETRNQVRVKAYDGESWSFVDGGGAAGLNIDSNQAANKPALAVIDGQLHIGFTEAYYYMPPVLSAQQVHVARFDESDASWTFLDGGTALGLNKVTQNMADQVSVIGMGGDVYAFWLEYASSIYQLRAAVYSPQPAYLKGDINGDGQVTPADALFITKYMQGKITLTPLQIEILDMDGNEVLDNTDVQMIMMIYLGAVA
ncbi:hypothetical protein IDH44_24870 [Paenibacillus sp. IB182496]|uniref:Dockerin domain-containing protein n=1 Tax=Paenibacillus sabuli TaxID=2772509 RepID=A0A927BX01_9BACL|nr:dockerin type I repeat-containing protein [Paenibacillus sabuli]MBD2848428.1 hypothetical protein [Paenibacillus sabuli]